MSGLRLGLTALGLNTDSGQQWWPQGAVLSYNFQSQQYMHNGANVDQNTALNTTRASVGYGENSDGSLVLFAPNEPRITDRGLLVEALGTNLITRSNELEHSAWGKINGVAVFDNYAAAPDGTMTASRIVFDADTGSRPEQVVSGLTQSNIYTLSVYLRAESGTPTVRIGTSGSTPGEFKDVVLSTQWQRYSNTFAAGGALEYPRVQNITGAADVIIQSWGWQYEEALSPGSAIITTASAATRAHDIIRADDVATTIAGLNASIVVLDVDILEISSTAIGYILAVSDGTGSNRIVLQVTASSILRLFFSDGSLSILDFGTITPGRFKCAFGIAGGTLYASVNGATAVTIASSYSIAGALTQCNIGAQRNGVVAVSQIHREIGVLDEIASAARVEEISSL